MRIPQKLPLDNFFLKSMVSDRANHIISGRPYYPCIFLRTATLLGSLITVDMAVVIANRLQRKNHVRHNGGGRGGQMFADAFFEHLIDHCPDLDHKFLLDRPVHAPPDAGMKRGPDDSDDSDEEDECVDEEDDDDYSVESSAPSVEQDLTYNYVYSIREEKTRNDRPISSVVSPSSDNGEVYFPFGGRPAFLDPFLQVSAPNWDLSLGS